jgi:hypothetical protein
MRFRAARHNKPLYEQGPERLRYENILADSVRRAGQNPHEYASAMPGWDNTARKGRLGKVYEGASPERFEEWLRGIRSAYERHGRTGDQLVFINAWNEWAEGAYLEPDELHAYANLEAVRRVMRPDANPRREAALRSSAPDEVAR